MDNVRRKYKIPDELRAVRSLLEDSEVFEVRAVDVRRRCS